MSTLVRVLKIHDTPRDSFGILRCLLYHGKLHCSTESIVQKSYPMPGQPESFQVEANYNLTAVFLNYPFFKDRKRFGLLCAQR
jgi:hypothetical protein